MKKQELFTVLLTVFSIVATFVILEFSYREYSTYQKRKMQVVPSEIKQFNPDYGWSLKPDRSAVSNRLGSIEYKINSKGIRDDEHEYARQPGKDRIVIIGDSRTFGFGVPIEAHFTRLLEGYCTSTEVINLGVSGFGVDQELLYLEKEGMKYKPDLVIAYVAHYGNHRHMHTVRFGKSKPKFELSDGGLSLINHPVQQLQKEEKPLLYSEIFRSIEKLFYNLNKKSRINNDNQQNELNENDQDFMKNLHALGNAIILEMKNFSKGKNAKFLLITPIDELIEFSKINNIYVLDTKNFLNNHFFDLPDGLAHVNGPGNGVLAWEIKNFITSNDLPGC